jgi:hypothetical protein
MTIKKLKILFWMLRLRWLERKIKDPFNKRLSLKIDRAIVKLEGLL